MTSSAIILQRWLAERAKNCRLAHDQLPSD